MRIGLAEGTVQDEKSLAQPLPKGEHVPERRACEDSRHHTCAHTRHSKCWLYSSEVAHEPAGDVQGQSLARWES
eukprot:CAMPEP_0204124824 /NCGR_PEP_ID=MMETSP0361-20130328/10074_1 /ASSEMBLY_ACC=CAM_ASM_000343 /TAXON_ID=268821 /ORGANISM="Scrippsiella Hangoei, Strain SHTV-5" /LENGTH=73 /DNA_ID=CAMNT_0051076445 /DNA_START=278 /DNA_END=497 /DNA_ORIENTATION=-